MLALWCLMLEVLGQVPEDHWRPQGTVFGQCYGLVLTCMAPDSDPKHFLKPFPPPHPGLYSGSHSQSSCGPISKKYLNTQYGILRKKRHRA